MWYHVITYRPRTISLLQTLGEPNLAIVETHGITVPVTRKISMILRINSKSSIHLSPANRTMEELIELRVSEEHANLVFRDNEGQRLGCGITAVRKVIIRSDDPRIPTIVKLQEELRMQRDRFFGGAGFIRKYSAAELNSAEILNMGISPLFEPAGVDCGTVYDDGAACQVCGAGAPQVSELFLKLGSIPKSKDCAVSIAMVEDVVSQRFFDLVQENEITGVKLPEVCPRLTLRSRSRESAAAARKWYQFVVTSAPVDIVPPTRFGRIPFWELRPECPMGHYTGLWPLTEVTVDRAGWDGSDIFRSKQLFGVRGGVLRPFPYLLITQRVYRLIVKSGMRGFKFHVAHFA